MKKTIIASVLGTAIMLSIATGAVTSTSTVITGNGTLKVTQLEVLNSSGGASTVNENIPPGGINNNSKWNLLLDSDVDIVSIVSINVLLTGPTGSTTVILLSGGVYNVDSNLGSPTIGVYTAGDVNVDSVNFLSISGRTLPAGTRQLVVADFTVPANFASGAYNPDTVGETFSVKFTVNGQDGSGAFISESTSTITVVPEPSAGLMGMIGLTGFLILRRRR